MPTGTIVRSVLKRRSSARAVAAIGGLVGPLPNDPSMLRARNKCGFVRSRIGLRDHRPFPGAAAAEHQSISSGEAQILLLRPSSLGMGRLVSARFWESGALNGAPPSVAATSACMLSRAHCWGHPVAWSRLMTMARADPGCASRQRAADRDEVGFVARMAC